MRIVHLGLAILSMFLVFVSVLRAADSTSEQDRMLDDLSNAMNQPQAQGTYQAAPPQANAPDEESRPTSDQPTTSQGND